MQREFLSKGQSARLLGVSRTTFWHMQKEGTVKPSVIIRGREKFLCEDLSKAIDNNAKRKNR